MKKFAQNKFGEECGGSFECGKGKKFPESEEKKKSGRGTSGEITNIDLQKKEDQRGPFPHIRGKGRYTFLQGIRSFNRDGQSNGH